MSRLLSPSRLPILAVALAAATAALVFSPPASGGVTVPTLSMAFEPSVIGPGSTTTLTFTIDNQDIVAVDNLAFTDTMPATMVVAPAPNAATTCPDSGPNSPTVNAVAGGSTITFSNGGVAASSSCTVSVNVTSSVFGTHTNESSALSTSVGVSSSATAQLEVGFDRPGFTKSFSPSTIFRGARSTLTFTINNGSNDSSVDSLSYTDALPTGMRVAEPSMAMTTCGSTTFPPELTAVSGSGTISLLANGFFSDPALLSGSSCTVTVDVTASAGGTLPNTTTSLMATFGSVARSSGKASAELVVNVAPLNLTKSFSDDPVQPASIATIEFTIDNFNRSEAATGISFSDDLSQMGPGFTALDLPALDVCGPGSSVTGTTTITLSNATLPAEGSCTFSVPILVSTATGVFANTTGPVSGTVASSAVTGNPATDMLSVAAAPTFNKEFFDATFTIADPVLRPGDSVGLRFSITDVSPGGLTDISFIDDLTAFLPFPVDITSGLGSVCNGGTLAVISIGTEEQALSLTGATLGGAPAACSFGVVLALPSDLASGVYTNTTEAITARVQPANNLVTGSTATDSFSIVAAPQLMKSFATDTVVPGDTTALTFVLTHGEDETADATDIGFTDDLAAMLPGATVVGTVTPDPPCGPGSSLTTSVASTLLTLSSGSLAPGATCEFSVDVLIPSGADVGAYVNTTSVVSGTVNGVSTVSQPATTTLNVVRLRISKQFIGNPVAPGADITLAFTIDNTLGVFTATSIGFSDPLDDVLAGLTATLPSNPDPPCGAGSQLTFTGSTLSFSNGSLEAGQMCTFAVTITVPANATEGVYNNTTSDNFAIVNGTFITLPPAVHILVVDTEFLEASYCNGVLVTVNLAVGQVPTQAADVILGTSLSDTIDGLGGDDLICAAEGDDTIVGGAGEDTILGGPGNDTIFGGLQSDTVFGGAGDDTIWGEAANDIIYGNEGNDQIHGGPGIDRVFGHGGADQIFGDDGFDRLYGGTGNDTIRGGLGEDRLWGQGDNDTLYGENEADLIYGGIGDDTIFGGGSADTIHAQGGNDVITGGGGADIIYGHPGDDTIDGGLGRDQLFGHGGIDTINGGASNDEIFGGGNGDVLHGNEDNDTIEGQGGNDDMFGDAGTDSCHGGIGGSDTATDCETVSGVP